jgi:NAD(P)-dependent dehydrogenase (short-subunit alcohol dehydrogenase family)
LRLSLAELQELVVQLRWRSLPEVIAYAQQQAKVVVVGRRIDEGEETVRLIKEAGGEAIFVQADVTKAADVKAMVDKAVSVFGRLDIAFNNAGTIGENPSSIEQTEAEYDRTMNVNVKGVWLSMKYEIAQMLKQGSGSIVNTDCPTLLPIPHRVSFTFLVRLTGT